MNKLRRRITFILEFSNLKRLKRGFKYTFMFNHIQIKRLYNEAISTFRIETTPLVFILQSLFLYANRI